MMGVIKLRSVWVRLAGVPCRNNLSALVRVLDIMCGTRRGKVNCLSREERPSRNEEVMMDWVMRRERMLALRSDTWRMY